MPCSWSIKSTKRNTPDVNVRTRLRRRQRCDCQTELISCDLTKKTTACFQSECLSQNLVFTTWFSCLHRAGFHACTGPVCFLSYRNLGYRSCYIIIGLVILGSKKLPSTPQEVHEHIENKLSLPKARNKRECLSNLSSHIQPERRPYNTSNYACRSDHTYDPQQQL